MKLTGIPKLTHALRVQRKALRTGRRMQVVASSLRHKEFTREEVHAHSDQMIYVLHGDGEALLGGQRHDLQRGDGLFVAAGKRLRLRNTGDEALRLLTVLSPPVFPEDFTEPFQPVAGDGDPED